MKYSGMTAMILATALVRPMLRAGGIVSTLKLLESPTLTVTFKDVKGRETVKTYKGFELFDDAESVCRFKVPWNLSNVKFKLEGRVKRVTGGDDERPSAAWSMNVNEIANFVAWPMDTFLNAAEGRASALRTGQLRSPSSTARSGPADAW